MNTIFEMPKNGQRRCYMKVPLILPIIGMSSVSKLMNERQKLLKHYST